MAEQLRLSDRRIVITGAGGWLGLATLDLLADALGGHFVDRVQCFGATARTIILGGGRSISQQPLEALSSLSRTPSSLLHFAFLTKDRAEGMAEAEYRAANVAIRDKVLAALSPIGVDRLFGASSGAAAKADDPQASAAMRLYGELKLLDEEAFAEWASGTPGRLAVIGRIFNVTGPYINKHEAYAIASFILDALAGRAIAVRATRRVVRANVAIRELMSLVFAMLAEDRGPVVRFDSGGDPLELGELATVVSHRLSGRGVQRAAITDPVADIYHGDVAAYRALLKRHGIGSVALGDQIAETAAYLQTISH